MNGTGRMAAVWVAAVLAAARVGAADGLKPGDAMPKADAKMKNVDGRLLALADVKGKAGTLVVFSCNHCPFVKAWQDRLVRIGNDAVKKGVGVAFVNANDPATVPEDGLDGMKALAASKGYQFPYLVDETADVARAFGATRTPEAYLFNAEGNLVYHGTVDDSTYEPDKVKQAYLSDAVAALLAGTPIAAAETKAVGCGIKFRAAPAP